MNMPDSGPTHDRLPPEEGIDLHTVEVVRARLGGIATGEAMSIHLESEEGLSRVQKKLRIARRDERQKTITEMNEVLDELAVEARRIVEE